MSTDFFQVMAKPVGALCNLDCTYCYYLEKKNLYPGTSKWLMNKEILELFIRQRIESEPSPVVLFAWQGGEPSLAGIDYYRQIVLLQEKYASRKKIENTYQTNGVLLDDEWCMFFKEQNFLVGVSIDGPEQLHNRYRKNKKGDPSFKQAMDGIEKLKKHKVEFNTLTCIQKDNSYYPSEVYEFLKSIGSRYMQFIPVIERNSGKGSEASDNSVEEYSVESLQFGLFLSSIFDIWVRNDAGRYFVNIFDIALQSWMHLEPDACVFSSYCGNALVLEHNGDVYSCDHFVFPEYKLGNINDTPLLALVNSEKQIKFGKAKSDGLPEECLQCTYLFACRGECPKHRFSNTPDGKPGLNYLCEGYKYFYRHIDPYMKYMASELSAGRPPSNVIRWTKEKDHGFPSLRPGRNDECPCKSGRKYKNCCIQ